MHAKRVSSYELCRPKCRHHGQPLAALYSPVPQNGHVADAVYHYERAAPEHMSTNNALGVTKKKETNQCCVN